LGDIFIYANRDERVKCIVIHGGDSFSAGNDVEAFQIGRDDIDNVNAIVQDVIKYAVNRMLTSLFDLEKPLVAMVQGFAIGIGFTMLSMADFVYCSPDARFFTPFMQSYQSPEGGSSKMFPEIFGPHKASEILL
jgi:peroxisomal 3,2-trans-enoyl-CoA isomerase